MHFKIITPAYNVDKWIATNLMSVMGQEHQDYEVILLDDISTDKTVETAKNLVKNDSRFKIVTNDEKCEALKNICRGIDMLNPKDEDIIVLLDGDDWLKDRHVLSKVKDVYCQKKCLVTYGTFMTYPHGERPWNVTRYPQDTIDAAKYREDPQWRASHLRTFKYGLWKRINTKDLQNSQGEYYMYGWDLAIMFPILEMAGNRQEYIADSLYVYNRSNPLNCDKVNHELQLSEDREVRRKEKYERVDYDN